MGSQETKGPQAHWLNMMGQKEKKCTHQTGGRKAFTWTKRGGRRGGNWARDRKEGPTSFYSLPREPTPGNEEKNEKRVGTRIHRTHNVAKAVLGKLGKRTMSYKRRGTDSGRKKLNECPVKGKAIQPSGRRKTKAERVAGRRKNKSPERGVSGKSEDERVAKPRAR